MRISHKLIAIILLTANIILTSFSVHATTVDEFTISKDKSTLALKFDDDTIGIYSLKTGELLHKLGPVIDDDEYIDTIVFVDNNTLMSVYSGSYSRTWDLNKEAFTKDDTDRDLLVKLVSNSSISNINPKNNEAWIADNNTIRILDTKSKKEKAILRFTKDLHIDEIENISISEDGKYASLTVKLGNSKSKAMVIDTTSYAIIMIIKPDGPYVAKTQFLGNHLLLLESSYPIEVWDINTEKRHFNFTKKGSRNNLNLQQIAKEEFTPYNIGSRINGLDVNPKTGNIIVTGTGYPLGAIEINPKGEMLQVFQNIYSTGYDTRYSPDGQLAAFAFHGEHLLVFDVETGKINKEYDLGGVPSGTRITKFSRDSKFLAAGSDDNTLSIIDVTKKEVIDQIKFSAGVFSLLWINNNKILVGTELELYELNLDTKEKKSLLDTPSTALDGYFKNGELAIIAVGRTDEDIMLLDKNFKKIKTFNQTDVGRISFSKNGNKLIATSNYETMIWDIETSKNTLCESDDQLWAMAYNKNNQLIYTGGDSGRVDVWTTDCKALNKQ